MRLLLCLLLSLCKVSKAGSWLYPYPTPTNPETWYIGETKQLWWETTLDNYWMNIKQQSMSDSTGKAIIFRKETAFPELRRMNWSVQSYNFDLDVPGTLFYFELRDIGLNASLTSNFFKISKEAPPNPTIACSSNAATTIIINTTTQTISTTENAQPSEIQVLEQKARMIGIGLGIGLGIPLILALGSIALLFISSRCSRIEQNQGNRDGHGLLNVTKGEHRQDDFYKAEASSESEIFEAPHFERVHEAPDGGHVVRFG